MPDITRLLDRLERAGLVHRYRDTRDRRVVRGTLTPEGSDLVERMAAPLEALHCDLVSHLDADERKHLVSLLRKARRAGGKSQ